MVDVVFIDVYRKKLKALIAEKERKVGRGNCPTFDDYKEDCGRIRGYEEALREFNDLVKQYYKGSLEDDGEF